MRPLPGTAGRVLKHKSASAPHNLEPRDFRPRSEHPNTRPRSEGSSMLLFAFGYARLSVRCPQAAETTTFTCERSSHDNWMVSASQHSSHKGLPLSSNSCAPTSDDFLTQCAPDPSQKLTAVASRAANVALSALKNTHDV
jgi:hypothetical protein